MSNRTMLGIADLTGESINGLKVTAMVVRHPAPRYDVKCLRCGSRQVAGQRDLTFGTVFCCNSACARTGLHEEANMTLAQFRRREEMRQGGIR
jgi:hypothetical protein